MKKILFYSLLLGLILFNFQSILAEDKLAVNAIQMVDKFNGWAIGNKGLIMQWNGSEWQKVDLPFFTESDLYTLSFTSANNGFIGGQNGILLYYNGASWQQLNIFNNDIHAIFCAAPNVVFIESAGSVYKMIDFVVDYDNMLEESGTVLGMHFTDSNNGCAVYANGVSYVYNGVSWDYKPTSVSLPLRSVFFTSIGNGWAVGDNGTILKYYSDAWHTETSPTSETLNSIKMLSASEGWIAGNNGTMLHYDGSSWVNTSLSSAENMNGISLLDSDFGWAVSNLANEYRLSGTGWVLESSLPATENPIPVSTEMVKLVGVVQHYNSWNADTVKILGPVLIPDQPDNLIIQKGTVVDFLAGSALNSQIPLYCIGSSSDSIKFINSSNIANAYSISINMGDADTTFIKYCRISNVGSGSGFLGGNFRIQNTVFANNGGITFNTVINGVLDQFKADNSVIFGYECAKLDIENSIFQNSSNAGLHFNRCNFVTLTNSTIFNNLSNGIYSKLTTLEISKCRIHNNQGGVGGAIYGENCKITIDNSIITNNESTSGAQGGGAIYSIDGKLFIINSTLAYNKSVSAGGAIYSNYSSGQVYNSILWGNVAAADTNQFFLKSTNSGISFANCDMHYDSTDFSKGAAALYTSNYVNNIITNPSFVHTDKTAGRSFNGLSVDWKTNTTAKLINAGTTETGGMPLSANDIENKSRVYNQFIDIGPYEYHITNISTGGTLSANTTWASDTVLVTSNLIIANGSTLFIKPGTRVILSQGVTIKVEGSIKAIGTFNAPIVITSATYWSGMLLDNLSGLFDNNDSTIFRYCRFENINNGAILLRRFKKVCIEYSVFTNCAKGSSTWSALIHAYASEIKFNYNHVYNCSEGPFYGYGSTISFVGNTIESNITTCCLNLNQCEGRVLNNSIRNNQKTLYGGLLNLTASNLVVNGNLISNNTINGTNSKAAITFDGMRVLFSNNTVVNNDSIGVSAVNCSGVIANNILHNNKINISIFNSVAAWNISNNLISAPYSLVGLSPQNPVDGNPNFVKPSSNIGLSSDAVAANWNLLNIASGINAGTIDTTGLQLLKLDLLSNERIHGLHIDLGAFENQGAVVEFTKQAVGGSYCTGDTVTLFVATKDTAFLQWQKDGLNIDGATFPELKLFGVTEQSMGNYSCKANNVYGETTSLPVLVQIRYAPVITFAPASAWLKESSSFTATVVADGSKPLSYMWYKNNVAIGGATNSELNFASISQNEEASYYCKVSNTCGQTSTAPIDITIVPQICMVTADQYTGHNTVVWSRNSSRAFLKYNIYREGGLSGFFEKIGEKDYSQYTAFSDTITNPQSQAYVYKITATDSSGLETDIRLCDAHKTIHLLVTEGVPSGYQLDWDEYIGFPYEQYKIFRSVNNSPFTQVHLQAATTRTWKDESVVGDTIQYYLSVEKSDACYPSVLNVVPEDSVKQTVSNLQDNNLKLGREFNIISQPVGLVKCMGDSALFTVETEGENLSFQWYKSNDPIVGATSKSLVVYNVSRSDEAFYKCKVSGISQSEFTAYASLTVKVKPIFQFQPDNSFVELGSNYAISVAANGAEPISYQWYKDGTALTGETVNSFAIAAFEFENEGHYFAEATNICGRDTCNEFIINALPTSNINGSDTLFCEGDTVRFEAKAGTSAVYQWFKNGSVMDGKTGAVLQLNGIGSNDGGNYSCRVTTEVGIENTSAIYIAVNEKPEILSQTESQWVGKNSAFTCEVAVMGAKPLQYQWQYGDSVIEGETNPRFILAGFSKSNEGSYKCKVENVCGTLFTLPVALYILPSVAINSSGLICESNTIDLSVPDDGLTSFQWYKDGFPIVGEMNSTLSLKKVSTNDQGNYSCLISKAFGSMQTIPRFISVLSPPEKMSEPTSQWIRIGETASAEMTVIGSKPIEFQWYFNDTALLPETTAKIIFATFGLGNQGEYYCKANNGCGTVNSSKISFFAVPVISATGADNAGVICENAALLLSVPDEANTTYQWYKDGNILSSDTLASFAIANISFSDQGNYSCFISKSSSSIQTASKFISVQTAPAKLLQPVSQWIKYGATSSIELATVGSKPIAYQWYKNDTLLTTETNAKLFFASFVESDQGIYKCHAHNNCGDISSDNISILLKPEISLITNRINGAVCEGDTLSLDVKTSYDAQYKWFKDGKEIASEVTNKLQLINVNEDVSGNYTCHISTNYGDFETDAFYLSIQSAPVITSNALTQWLKIGSTTSSEIIASGTKPILYEWYKDNALLPNETLAKYILATFASENQGIYVCKARNKCGYAMSDNFALLLKPVISITNSGKSIVQCEGDTTELTVSTYLAKGYQWYKDGVILESQVLDKLTLSSLTQENAGIYSCLVTTEYGSILTDAVNVLPRIAPTITTQPSETWINELDNASIYIDAEGSKPLIYEWFNGTNRVDSSLIDNLLISGVVISKEGLYRCKVSNVCGSVESKVVGLYILPKVCLITADMETGKNLVVWERKADRNIKGYNVYRESVVRDLYEKIGFLSYSKEGVFVDSLSTPELHQNLYKISVVGANDAISPMSNYHKTLFLQYVSAQGGVNLMWQPYEIEGGSIEFKSYVLFKGTDPNNLKAFDTISSSLQVYTDTTKTSLTELTYYRIKGLLFDTCNSQTLLKAGGGPFVETVSNLEDNRLRSTGITASYADRINLTIYPQPAIDRITISCSLVDSKDSEIEILNLLGEQIAGFKVKINGQINIDLAKYKLSSGLYMLRLRTSAGTAVKPFIVNR